MKESIKYLLFISFLLSFTFLNAQEDSDTLESYSIKEFIFSDSIKVSESIPDFIDELVEDVITEEEVDIELEWDTMGIDVIRNNYQLREFDTARLAVFRDLDEFDYSEAENGDSAISLFFQRFFRKMFGDLDMNLNSDWMRYILIGIAAILLIWFLLKNELKTFVKKKDTSEIVPQIGDLDISISRDILQEKLDKAEQEGRYREAVRYSYLMILKKLNNENIIVWKDYKLGQDYVNEISNVKTKAEFQAATNQFNYAWYGNYKVDKVFHDQTKKHSINIQNLIES